MNVLIVEDDERVADALSAFLRQAGYDTVCVSAGAAALEALDADTDVVLLDLGLPDIDGFDVCRMMRERSEVPIIVATARSHVEDRIKGLQAGADDFVVKPYDARELVARIEAITRRTRQALPSIEVAPDLEIEGITIDFSSRQVRVEGEEVDLTPKEFDIIAVLGRYPGVAVSRERIIREVWGADWSGFSRSLEVHVGSIRSKLDRPGLVATVRGVGYRLTGS